MKGESSIQQGETIQELRDTLGKTLKPDMIYLLMKIIDQNEMSGLTLNVLEKKLKDILTQLEAINAVMHAKNKFGEEVNPEMIVYYLKDACDQAAARIAKENGVEGR